MRTGGPRSSRRSCPAGAWWCPICAATARATGPAFPPTASTTSRTISPRSIERSRRVRSRWSVIRWADGSRSATRRDTRPALRGLALLDSRLGDVDPALAARWRGRVAGAREGRGYPTREAALAAFRFVPDEPEVAPDVVALLARHAIRERAPGDWTFRFDRAVLSLDGDRAGDLSGLLAARRMPGAARSRRAQLGARRAPSARGSPPRVPAPRSRCSPAATISSSRGRRRSGPRCAASSTRSCERARHAPRRRAHATRGQGGDHHGRGAGHRRGVRAAIRRRKAPRWWSPT